MTTPLSRHHDQPAGRDVAAEPRFMTPAEALTVALIAATMLLLYYDEWTAALRGARVAGDMYIFAPYILLLVAVIADLRRLAAAAAGVLLGITGLFVLSAILASMVGSNEGSPAVTMTIILQVPLFIACLRHARGKAPPLGETVLRARIALGLAVGAAAWMVLSAGLAHAG